MAALRPILGHLRRQVSNATMVSDFLAQDAAILLCGTCEWRMPLFWKRRLGYERIPGFHSEGRCDSCQRFEPCNMFVQCEKPYWREFERARQHAMAVRDQSMRVADHRRVTL